MSPAGATTVRRRFLAALVVALAAGVAFPKDETHPPAVYAKDVDFLLENLEKKAGHFFKLKGVDWAAVSKQFKAEVKSVKTDLDHVNLCQRLVARLRDGHAGLVGVKVDFGDQMKGKAMGGPRVHLLLVDDKAYVAESSGRAADQGVTVGAEVVAIDGKPIKKWLDDTVARLRDKEGYSTDHAALYAACHWGLADWAGTKITFELKQGATKKTVEVTREAGGATWPSGPLFLPKDVKELGRQSYGKTAGGFGYVHLRDVPAELPDQLDAMMDAIGDVPGYVLDMRANGGGAVDHEAVFGRFLAPGQTWPPKYVGVGKRPFTGSMVVIVDAGVRSAGETVAGMFKEDGRAYMIGDSPTHGMSSSKERLPVPSGLFSVYFSVETNKGRFNGGRGIEGIGVPPQEIVPYDPEEMTKGIDTQIRRAEELLKGGLPKGKVLYQPPDKK
jgi:C-terminal processing protease CtpA/Prc